MAKGLGAIMAELAGDEKKRRLETLEAPACPLCGEPMTASMAGWFCRSGSDDPEQKCPKMGVLEDAMYEHAPKEYVRKESGDDPFQGKTFAAVVHDGQLLVEFSSVRGGFGRTNLRLWAGKGVKDEDIPRLIQEHGWTWYEWASSLAYGEESFLSELEQDYRDEREQAYRPF